MWQYTRTKFQCGAIRPLCVHTNDSESVHDTDGVKRTSTSGRICVKVWRGCANCDTAPSLGASRSAAGKSAAHWICDRHTPTQPHLICFICFLCSPREQRFFCLPGKRMRSSYKGFYRFYSFRPMPCITLLKNTTRTWLLMPTALVSETLH